MQAIHLFHKNKNVPLNAILLFCFPLFFIYLADSAMSYIFPILVETSTHSNSMLGIIMALSSVLGAICDFSFPQFLHNRSWRFQLTAGIIIATLFPLFTHLGTLFSLIYFFIIATLIWGVYYEFLQFSQQSFVITEDMNNEYSQDWGLLFLIVELTTVLGPIIGSVLLKHVLVQMTATVTSIQLISFLFAVLVIVVLPRVKRPPQESQLKKTFNVIKELSYWHTLGERVWPVVITGIMVTFVSASYWTIGGLLGIEITKGKGWDWLVMAMVGIPIIIGAIILTRIPITRHKKQFSQLSLLFGGFLLCFLFLAKEQTTLALFIILLSSLAISFAGPLNEAVYSDLLERSGKSRLHLLGIAKSNSSIAYIIAPLFTGFLADRIDYYSTLSVVGGITAVVAGILLLHTPRKIKLPQESLQKMEI